MAYTKSLTYTHASAGGYEGGDEADERAESSRAEEHLQEVTERLQERLPSRYRRGVWAGEALCRTEGKENKKK